MLVVALVDWPRPLDLNRECDPSRDLFTGRTAINSQPLLRSPQSIQGGAYRVDLSLQSRALAEQKAFRAVPCLSALYDPSL